MSHTDPRFPYTILADHELLQTERKIIEQLEKLRRKGNKHQERKNYLNEQIDYIIDEKAHRAFC